MTGPMLTVEGLDVAYGDFQVLWGAELRVDEGEIVCVLGPNGAGKSTLMNTISGLVHPRAGRIT
ncbi:MAG: branched-chain amino acid ABC transporter ATP-binding protein, partial [Candidatus Rokuibacteriota bacterium]